MGATLIAVAAEGEKGRIYLSPEETATAEMLNEITDYYSQNSIENEVSHAECRGTFASNAQGRHYGFFEFKDYFTSRQLISLTTFSSLITELLDKISTDGGSKEYAQAVGTYLAFVIDRIADRGSKICSWDSSRDGLRNTFGLQGIPMAWSYAEGNPFSTPSGSYINMLDWIVKVVALLPANRNRHSYQADAQANCRLQDVMISTDPPYYDNVCYSDLSDFFYVWMRQSLKSIYPNLFQTMLVPKSAELVATPYRFNGNVEKAKHFFEDGMLRACQQIYKTCCNSIPVSI